MVESIIWWLALAALGWSIAPLVARYAVKLNDRGLFLTRSLGLYLWAYLLWLSGLFGAEWPKNLAWPLLLVMAATGWLWAEARRDFLGWLHANRRTVLVGEALWVVVFAFFALLRAQAPEAVGTEKPMEMAFIQAIYRHPVTPNPDPWFSGEGISYYHFGYFMAAMLAHLTRLTPGVAFNLTLAHTFAIAALSLFGAAANILVALGLSRRAWTAGAIVASLATLFSGTLFGLFEVLRSLKAISPALLGSLGLNRLATAYPGAASFFPDGTVEHWWWWRAARVFSDAVRPGEERSEVICEFPFFSGLLGDLHPHVLSLASWGLLWGVAVWLFVAPPKFAPMRWALLSLVIGGAAFTNIWDLPTAFVLLGGTYMLGRFRQRKSSGWWLEGMRDMVIGAIGAIVVYFPFYAVLQSSTTGIGVSPVHSLPSQFVSQWSIWLLPAAFLLGWLACSRSPLAASWPARAIVALTLVVCAALVAKGAYAGAALTVLEGVVALALLGSIGQLSPQRRSSTNNVSMPGTEALLAWSCLIGIALLIGAELFYIRDVFEKFSPRMNTVFKLHYQAWLLVVPVICCLVAVYLARAGRVARLMATPLLVALCVISLLYPVSATVSRWGTSRATVDATGFIASLPDEAAAIEWLKRNAGRDAVIVEAGGNSYSQYSFLSTYSGVPTVLGWVGHESQWRGDIPEIQERLNTVDSFYRFGDAAALQKLVERYGATHVVVGTRERSFYNHPLDHLPGVLPPPVFTHGSLAIYPAAPAAEPSLR